MFRLTAAVFLVTAAVNLQLPAYGVLAQEAGFTSGSMALLLQGYVAALLGVLVALGGVSDSAGRKSVVLMALGSSAVATGLVMVAPGVLTLGIARWFQGWGVGLVMGAATSWMSRLSQPARAARSTGLASTVGFGAGALATAGAGLKLTHAVWLGLAIAVWSSVLVLEDEAGERDRTWLRLPRFAVGTAVANWGITVGWGVSGIVVAVLPGVLYAKGHGGWGGGMLALMLGGGVIAQVDARRRDPTTSSRIGAVFLTLGVGVIAVGVGVDRLEILALGSLIAGGATHGWLYVGGLQRVAICAPGEASAVSAFFLCAYVGFGVPAIVFGWAVDGWGDAAFIGMALVVALGSLGIVALDR